MAQNSLDTLEQELKEAKQQHQEVATLAMTNFFSQIDAAMDSPDAAVALYQKAGGTLPDPTPVVTEHETESATERDLRQSEDQANLATLTTALQLHCGMMHYAALFIIKPDQKGLQDEWAAWLQKAAQLYPQICGPTGNAAPNPEPRNKRKLGAPRPQAFNPSELKGKAMRDSIISKFLDFKGWDDKDQGGWSVQSLPDLYRKAVLEPLRASPTADTLAAWDVYIGMVNADEKDNNRWDEVVYPPLQFDRACDDYAVTPSTEKLETLVNLIKANPTYPQVDEWISRVHNLMDDYRASHGGARTAAQNPETAPAPSAPATNSNVTITTVQQGDMTIITTHTNSAPVTNATPAP